jgi:hypothetical protein
MTATNFRWAYTDIRGGRLPPPRRSVLCVDSSGPVTGSMLAGSWSNRPAELRQCGARGSQASDR